MNTGNEYIKLNHLPTPSANLTTQRILTLHTNNLIRRLKRIKRLALSPTVPHTHIVLRSPPASLSLAQLAILAKVNDAWDSAQAGAEATACPPSFFDVRAASAHAH